MSFQINNAEQLLIKSALVFSFLFLNKVHIQCKNHNTDTKKYHASPSSEATEMTAAETSQWQPHAEHPCLCELHADVLFCRPCPPMTQALFEQGTAIYINTR